MSDSKDVMFPRNTGSPQTIIKGEKERDAILAVTGVSGIGKTIAANGDAMEAALKDFVARSVHAELPPGVRLPEGVTDRASYALGVATGLDASVKILQECFTTRGFPALGAWFRVLVETIKSQASSTK